MPVLKTLRVLEIGAGLSVQVAGMLLADLGARVVRVTIDDEETDESRVDHISEILTRNKCVLDENFSRRAPISGALKDALSKVDAVLVGGCVDKETTVRLWQAAREFNAQSIWVSMPSLPEDIADRYGVVKSEGALSALTGLYTDISINRSTLGLGPVYTDLPMASVYGAVHAVSAVLAAILFRKKTGLGDIIEVPLAAAAISAMGSNILKVEGQPDRYDIPPVPNIIKKVVLPLVRALSATGIRGIRRRIADLGDKMLPPLMRSYKTSDGKLVYIFAMDHGKLPECLFRALGFRLDELAPLVIAPTYAETRSDNLADPGGLSRKHKKFLTGLIADEIREHPASYWETKFRQYGVPFAIQRSLQDWTGLPQVRNAGLVLANNGTESSIALPGAFLAVGTRMGNFQPRKCRTVSSAFDPGLYPTERAPESDGSDTAPLSGLRVLDLSTMVAGPVCARTLAELGADVVKVDSPQPLHGPRMTCWYGMEVNQGKKTILLDIKSADGQRILQELLQKFDVLVHNFSESAATKLSLGSQEISRIAPHLTVCSIGAFQGTKSAEWDNRKGYDPVLQAATGIQQRFGSIEKPQLHAIASCIDYLTGYLGAFGVLAAIEGGEKRVSVSLAQAAQLIQLPYFSRDFERQSPAGQEAMGRDPYNSIYATKDGYLYVSVSDDKRQLFKGLLSCRADDKTLRGEFRSRKTEVWLAEFEKLGVEAVPVLGASGLADLGSEMIASKWINHPSGYLVKQLKLNYLKSTHWALKELIPFESPGSHTRQVLADVAGGSDIYRVLECKKVVASRLAERYLP